MSAETWHGQTSPAEEQNGTVGAQTCNTLHYIWQLTSACRAEGQGEPGHLLSRRRAAA